MLAHDLIAEESRGTRSSMGNQSLFFRKLHFQRFPKKRSDVPFDLLSFCLRATDYVSSGSSSRKTSSESSTEDTRSEEHTSELQSQSNLVCRLLLENKK